MTSIFEGQPSKRRPKFQSKQGSFGFQGQYINIPLLRQQRKRFINVVLGPQKMISSTSPSTVGDSSQSFDEFLFRGKSACNPSRYKWSYNPCKWPKIDG